MSKVKGRIVFVVNSVSFFISHRLLLANEAAKRGLDVHVISPQCPPSYSQCHPKVKFHRVPFSRGSGNPFGDVATIVRLYLLFVKLKPDIIHSITLKAIFLGGLAGRMARVNGAVFAISGLGTTFLSHGRWSRIRAWLILKVLWFLFQSNRSLVIVQNSSDRDLLVESKVASEASIALIHGSGIDLQQFRYVQEPSYDQIYVVMASRLLLDKGVNEFVEAARILADRGTEVVMRLIGGLDLQNKSCLPTALLEKFKNEGIVELLGHRSDIAEQYSNCNIVCLPSYREGLPKSLIEAAASGRAIVTTDVPGCRDAVINNVTGLLVPVKDPKAIADAIEYLCYETQTRIGMGLAARKLAEKRFGQEKTIEDHFRLYNELLKGKLVQ